MNKVKLRSNTEFSQKWGCIEKNTSLREKDDVVL